MSSYRRRLMLANQMEDNLYLYGNSVQDGTPTPDAPIEIMSVENPTIKVTGNNLFNNDFSLIKKLDFLNTDNVERSHYGYEIILPIGTYTIKAYQKSNFEAPVYIYGHLVDANYISKQALNTVVNAEFRTVTFTVENGDKLLIFDGYNANSGNSAHAESFFSTVDIQLNIGETALTEYEPYEEEVIEAEGYTLRGIGDYKDRIYTKDGKVWFEQRSGYYKTSLGQKVYTNQETSTGIQLYANNIVSEEYKGLGRVATEEEGNPGLATHFVYSERAYSGWEQTDSIMMLGARLWLLSDNFATESEGQAWFNENQVEVIYPLLNSIVTEITGSLAEKILAIDKSKNITIYSDNGVYGDTEVIEE